MARKNLAAEAAARGQGHLSVAELVALIHKVNPTDRGLSAGETQRRYALKSALQSRLICDWGAHLDIEMTDPELGVLAIYHRGHRRDAAHAVLSELSFEAREIVRQALHLSPESDERSALDDIVTSDANDELSVGDRAMEAWDYEAARAAYEGAFRSERAERSAAALLALLVEHLADDDAALQLSIPETALSPRVARLLAIADARSRAGLRAKALLPMLDARSEAEVRLLLAQAALAHADRATAIAHLEALRTLDPANGALLQLEEAIDQLAARERAPMESALSDALLRGHEPEIAAAAQRLLEVCPGHAKARVALATLEQARRGREVEALCASAEASERAGQLALAVHDLERAAELSLEGEALKPRIAALRKRIERERRANAVADAASAWERGDWLPYLALAPHERLGVRERVAPHPAFELLAQLESEKVRDPVRALFALAQASHLQAEGKPKAALDLLLEEGAESFSTGRVLLAKVQKDVRLQREAEQGALLERFLERLQAEDYPQARQLADEIRPEYLSEKRLGYFTEFRAFLDAQLMNEQRIARFVALAHDHPLEARELAAQRCSAHDAGRTAGFAFDIAGWRSRLDAAAAAILGLFPSRVVPHWSESAQDVHLLPLQATADASLEPDGQSAWLAEAYERFCFVRRFEVTTSKILSCTVIYGLTFLTHPRTTVFPGVVLLSGVGGKVLAFEHEGDGHVTRIAGFCDPSTLYGPVEPTRDEQLRVLFFGSSDKNERCYWECDVRVGRMQPLGAQRSIVALRLPERGPCLLQLDADGEVQLYGVRSKQGEPFGRAHRLLSAAPLPCGGGIVCTGTFPPGAPTEMALVLLIAGVRQPSRRVGLPGVSAAAPVASSRASGLVYLLALRGGRPELWAFDTELKLLWSIEAPGLRQLLTDNDNNYVVALFTTRSGPQLVSLGTQPPAIPADALNLRSVSLDGRENALSVDLRQEDLRRDLLALIARADDEVDAGKRFVILDRLEVWQARELQSMTRLAEAALLWREGPWGQRTHALAAWAELWELRDRSSSARQLAGMEGAWSEARMAELWPRLTAQLSESIESMQAERSDARGVSHD
jgi:hypothetical protein